MTREFPDELLSAFLDGELSPVERDQIERHLAASEADRQAINRWIRAPGHVDAVIDFDTLMRDPARPDRLRKEYDSDGLHPSIAGYKAMGDAVPLALFHHPDASR